MQPELSISRSAISANLQLCRSQLAPDARLWPVVKANGYGLGAEQMVTTLESAAAIDGYFVATAEEAHTLMQAHITNKPVAVLNGLSNEQSKVLGQQAIRVINSIIDLEMAANQTQQLTDHKLPVIIHLDSGMNRLGLNAPEVNYLTCHPGLLTGLNILFWMSHYASADQMVLANNTQHNLPGMLVNQQWQTMSDYLANLPPAPLSFAASAGLFLPKSQHGIFVRPGLLLYGGDPIGNIASLIQPVVSLRAKIIQISRLQTGQAVGYGETWHCKKPTLLATLAVGYADGINTWLANRIFAYTTGTTVVKCPVVGRISMDLTCVDISTADFLQVGDWLELINDKQTINDIATVAETIPYEILTNLQHRIIRKWN